MNQLLTSILTWCMVVFIALCPFKESVKALRQGALILAFGILLLSLYIWIRERRGEVERDKISACPIAWRPFMTPLAAIMAASLLSAIFSLAPNYSVSEYRKQILLFAIVFAATWNVIRLSGLKGLWLMIWGMAIGGGAAAIVGIIGYYAGSMIDIEAGNRALGTLESYTRSAMFFTFQLPLSLSLFLCLFKSRQHKKAILIICIIIISLWFILLTKTRGVWLSIGIVFLIMAVVSRRWFLIALILSGVLGAIMLSPALQERLSTFTRHSNNLNLLTSGRIEIWKNGFDAIRANPWLGVGYGPDIFLEDEVRAVHLIDNYKRQPDLHQFYLQLMAETGLLGVLAYLWFAVVLLWQSLFKFLPRLRTSIRAGSDGARSMGWASLGVWGALSAILIYGLIGNFYEDHNGMVFWACIGMAAGLTALSVPVDKSTGPAVDPRAVPIEK